MINFSGIGAHHQNGIAERAIQTIMSWARAMLLHAFIMWPDQVNLELWPFAMEHAVYIWNNLPNKQMRIAPLEIFTASHFANYDHLNYLHIWGCPAYVLDPKLQDRKKILKWDLHSQRGQFLGISPDHSTTIGCILNFNMGFISPQYHVIYDDLFTMVPNAESGGIFHDTPLTQDHWEQIVTSGHERIVALDDLNLHPHGDPRNHQPSLHDDWLTPWEAQH